MSTYFQRASQIERAWHLVDAEGQVLGRMSTEVAILLRGKHKPTFTPNLDGGDHVVVVNAAKLVMTANKGEQKRYYRHSGYPGGISSRSYSELLAQHPEQLVRRSVRGMLPKGPLGRQMLRKLKVYAGPEHRHSAQSPLPYQLGPARKAS